MLNFLEHRIPPPLVLLIVGGLMWLAAGTGPLLALPAAVRIGAAVVLALAGIAIALSGVIAFHHAKTTINPLKPEEATSLVASGIYTVTRNPMYLGMLVLLTGWAVYLASPVALIGLPAFWLYITRFQIVPEERILAKLFGDSFTAYTAKVRRWI